MQPRTQLSHELVSMWLEQTTDYAVFFIDNDGVIVAATGGVETTLNYAREELVGKHLAELFMPQDVELGLDKQELLAALADGRSMDDRWHARKSGAPVWISGAMTTLRTPDNQPAGFVKVMRDRTDLRAEIDTLRSRVAALLHAKENDAAALATLAHELRNLLAPLQAGTRLMQRLAHDEPLQAPIGIIDRQVATLKRLVDDMMDVARSETGRLDLDIKAIELQAAIRGVADARREQAASRGLQLSVSVPPVPIVIEADPQRLEQIFANLLSNALKYTPSGGHVSINATVEAAEAVIRIADTGIGIAAEMLPRIFELFTQESVAHAMAAEGLGIGLALVKRLVDAHAGIVEVRSAGRGLGSEFTVRLPLQHHRGLPEIS